MISLNGSGDGAARARFTWKPGTQFGQLELRAPKGPKWAAQRGKRRLPHQTARRPSSAQTLDSSRCLRMDGLPGFFKRNRLRLGLAPTLVAALAVAVIAFDLGARAGDNFKPLDERKIRATIAGKDIGDGAHWSLYLRPDGALVGVESGARLDPAPGMFRTANFAGRIRAARHLIATTSGCPAKT